MTIYDYRKLQNGSDIRGVALEGVPGETVNLTEETTTRIAAAFVFWLTVKTGKKASDLKIAIGRDSRLSGPALMETFAASVAERGARVLLGGMASTPAMFMSTIFDEFKADGAVMITASHLPYNRNGFKFFSAEGGLDKGDITDIITFAESDSVLLRLEKKTPLPFKEIPLMDVYSAHLRSLITESTKEEKPLQGLKIVVDAGNGAGGFYAHKVLEPLGADVSSSQFLEPDGNFPNHQPNPENKEAMASICAKVKEAKADFGIIFDTDVDRSSAVDEKGKEISRNAIVALAAALIYEEHPSTTVVTDSITSTQLTKFLEENLGLKHLRFKRGYRNVINKAIALCQEGIDSQLAIETSGHAAYKENYFLDDGAYLATKIVIKAAKLHKEGLPLSSLLTDLKEPLEAEEIRIPITESDFAPYGDKVLERVREFFLGFNEEGLKGEIVTPNYEGIRVSFTGTFTGWFLLRKSLHDPIMPLNIEANEEGGCREIKALVYQVLREFSGLSLK